MFWPVSYMLIYSPKAMPKKSFQWTRSLSAALSYVVEHETFRHGPSHVTAQNGSLLRGRLRLSNSLFRLRLERGKRVSEIIGLTLANAEYCRK